MDSHAAELRKLKVMTQEERARVQKKLREKYMTKYGYNKKVIIDDILADFVKSYNYEIEPYAYRRLDKYLKTRLTGIMSSDMLKYSHHQALQVKKKEEEKKRREEEAKKRFKRDCMCEQDAEALRQKNRAYSIRNRPDSIGEDLIKQRVNNEMEERRPAGFNRKPRYERRHYSGTALANSAVFAPQGSRASGTSTNYFKLLLDEQIKQKQQLQLKEDKYAERFKLRMEEEKEDMMRTKPREDTRTKGEYEEYLRMSKRYEGDANEDLKMKLQEDMILGFENMNPIVQLREAALAKSNVLPVADPNSAPFTSYHQQVPRITRISSLRPATAL